MRYVFKKCRLFDCKKVSQCYAMLVIIRNKALINLYYIKMSGRKPKGRKQSFNIVNHNKSTFFSKKISKKNPVERNKLITCNRFVANIYTISVDVFDYIMSYLNFREFCTNICFLLKFTFNFFEFFLSFFDK